VNSQLDPAMKEFSDEVNRFIDQHWPVGASTGSPMDVENWQKALVEVGWSVPHWPVTAGGTGWDATQMFIWRQACARRGVPELDDAGRDVIGPWLLTHGSDTQQNQYLPDIVVRPGLWSLGFVEPEAGTDLAYMRTLVEFDDSQLTLNGVKSFVAGTTSAQYLCVLAKCSDKLQFGLFAVDLQTPGVLVQPTNTLAGEMGVAEVQLQQVVLPRSAQMGPICDGEDMAGFLLSSAFSTLARSAVAQAQLEVLDTVIEALQEDDALHAKRHALAVDLAALQAMELRFVDALQRGMQPPFSLVVLRLKSREILLQLGALQVESFGYYALPYPDEMLLHNEGSIGPTAAGTTIRQTLKQHVRAVYEDSAEQLKDQAWQQLKPEK
jgi:alkylation response protein AidB-like acyl-CoA dehydrogenase